MELLLHQWGDWPELYRNTDKTEATEIVIIDSQMNYRGKLDTYNHAVKTLRHDFFMLYFKQKSGGKDGLLGSCLDECRGDAAEEPD